MIKLSAYTRSSLLTAFFIVCIGLSPQSISEPYRIKGQASTPFTAAQNAVLRKYDEAFQAALSRFDAELRRRIPDYQVLKAIDEKGAFETSILLHNEVAALLQTMPNSDGPEYEGGSKLEQQMELERLATRWFEMSGRGYWAMIRAAQEQRKNEDATANQWFSRALSAGFVDNELRELPAILLEIGQAWIFADFPKLTPELSLLGRRSSVGMVAAEMIPLILMPSEMIWNSALERLCVDADQVPLDAKDEIVLVERKSQCKRAKKILIGQVARRLKEYGVTDISPIPPQNDMENNKLDDQLLAPFKVLECQLGDERAYVERLTHVVESIENKRLGLYLMQLDQRCAQTRSQ